MIAPKRNHGIPIALLSVLVMCLGLAAFAKDEPNDPFSRANRYQPELGLTSKKLASLIDFKVTVEPAKAKPGEIVRLTIAGNLKSGYHTYPLTQRAPDQTTISKISLEENRDLAPLFPIQESPPEFVINQINDIDLEHAKNFTWSQDILVLPGAGPGIKDFDIFIHLQVCDNNACYGPGLFPPVEARVEVLPGPAPELSPETRKRLDLKNPVIQVIPPPAELLARAKKAKADEEARMAAATSKKMDGSNPTKGGTNAPGDILNGDENSLWGLLGAAFGGAFFMLLTPCVFPMIPITVNFFLKQSEKEHHNPLRMASVYSGTIIVLLTVVMLALGNVVIALANNPWFNLALGGILILFALSLFGMFELELPSSLARFTSAREGQGGLLGAVFMALTFTITSFTCTGPFLGVMLAPIAGIKPPIFYLVLAALVYSTTFAAPFFVMALFPSMLKKLPKSGGWLNIIKVVMGFLELGAALKFLANTDFFFNPGNPRIFSFDTVLCAWIALSFACGLYLIGVYRLPHDDLPQHIGVLRMLFATIFFGLTVYLTPALFGIKLKGVVGENVIAFLPPRLDETGGFSSSSIGQSNRLAWHLHYQDAWQEAVNDNKLILIDFTGVNCTNCRDNEQNVFPLPDVVAAMSKYVRVQLYTDTVPDRKLTSLQAKDQADRNARWRDKIADPANPTYVVFRPEKDQPYDAEDFLKGKTLRIERGKIFDVPAFVTFLREPLQEKSATTTPVALK
jgi:thiol:disulfide interchange protein